MFYKPLYLRWIILFLLVGLTACASTRPSRNMNDMTADELRRELVKSL